MTKTRVFDGTEDRRPVLAMGVRTPFLKAGTAFREASAADLGTWAIREVLQRSGVRPDEVDEVILGSVGPTSRESNVARVAALRAGIPESVPAYTVNRNCASGLQSIEDGARRIAAGEGKIYVVGGTESMSSYPLIFGKKMTGFFEKLARSRTLIQRLRVFLSFRPSFLAPRISLVEGLTDPYCGLIMGLTAEKLAARFAISRSEQDAFGLRSHKRASAAQASGELAHEIFTTFPGRSCEPVAQDNGPRRDQSLEALGKLRPYFDRREGTVTVGNTCPITDGAAALLLVSEAEAKRRSLPILGVLKSASVSGLGPDVMGLGPAFAAPAAIAALGMQSSDIGRWELNEAFAAQVLACQCALDRDRFAQEELGLSKAFGAPDAECLNARGGAIALGHPVGATGSRLVLTLLDQLRNSGGGHGVATLCVGGGQGAAQVWEAA